jgi:hypothetical protein
MSDRRLAAGYRSGRDQVLRRRSRNERTFWRLPHTAMSHHTAERLREVS